MASLAEVAQAAGVTKSTVSRAFLHPTMVSPPTRDRILRLAEEMGFQPNLAARALSTGRTGLIGLVVPTLAQPLFGTLVMAAQGAIEEGDRQGLVVISENSAEHEEQLITTLAHEVDGLIIAGSQCDNGFLKDVAQRLPLVLVDRKVGRLPAVLIDTSAGIAAIADHLFALGHRRLCHVSGPPGPVMDRQRAVLQAHADANGAEVVFTEPTPATVEAGIRVTDEVLASKATAVIGHTSSIVLGLLSGLIARGVGVPDPLSLVSMDDFIHLRATDPPTTVLHLPLEEAGRAAVGKLAGILNGESPGRPVVLTPELIIRGSSGVPTHHGGVARAKP
jgi:LacI family transcriptional regulator, galactose operon repressor